ncbi:PEP-utilizing enzyme [Paenibacillus sp. TAB 01]|uniref:PEP-utilizing enzyme n=1 Tax=Paenibacillus sp. TAB 01 TaxID=3368988 RepID=UPI003753863C
MFSGNIFGRAYTNISLGLSLYPAFGKEMTPLIQRMSDVFGHMPEGVRVPVYPFSRMSLLRTMIPLVFTRLRKMRKAARAIPRHLAENAEVCAELTQRIQQTDTAAELALLWRDTLLPLNFAALWAALTGGRGMVIAHKLNQELTRLAGQEDANTLLSNLRGDAVLESLGPVIGISCVMKGDMGQEEYKRSYGHRGPHEFELSFPHPGEANDWLAAQMEQFAASGVNVEELLQKQNKQYEEARERLNRRQPAKTVKRIGKQLQKIAEAARLREAVRSEWTRTFRVNRAFALQAGKLTGIGEAVHFLYIDELLELLGGDRSALKHVPARRETHEKYQALPPLPSLIRGRFDAQQWAGDPHRRVDYYDAGQPAPPPDRSETLKGFAGAAGRVEGSVRVLYRPEEGGELQVGEILVASTTNVGWTPLFPRAAAIITDIGAPLSHAAIVARELGIPAVVGCGSATARLKTGDRVIVDGGQGLVYLVNRG